MEEDLKWQKLLWAVVLALSIYVFFIACFVRPHEILGTYPYMVIGWWLNLGIGVIALGLRARKIVRPKSFGYVLAGTINIFMAILDVYFLLNYPNVELKWFLISVVPLVFSAIIFTDYCKKAIK